VTQGPKLRVVAVEIMYLSQAAAGVLAVNILVLLLVLNMQGAHQLLVVDKWVTQVLVYTMNILLSVLVVPRELRIN